MYLYGTLMAHRVMGEFLRADFEGHERCQPHINTHLVFESTASRSQLKSLSDEVAVLRKENAALIDKVAGFARRFDSLSHPPRNNGGGGGGGAGGGRAEATAAQPAMAALVTDDAGAGVAVVATAATETIPTKAMPATGATAVIEGAWVLRGGLRVN